MAAAGIGACTDPRVPDLQRRINALESENARLLRAADDDRRRIDELTAAVVNLQSFDDPSGATLFDPVELRIADLSRGKDYDGQPGDDGVTVYVSPIDANGNSVTVGGRITVQLVDNADMERPRVVGLVRLEDPAEIGRAWHGKFLTQHYVVKVPWSPDAAPPASRSVEVHVEFVSFLTGRAIRTHKTIPVDIADNARQAGGPW
ncbi:MAG: hypothetical protein C4547_16725 [Phycisphaerales bacterium]|nr:MAG: hypothetical protein C4547_16725 [Phycisphaerales bacterium]